jgi:cation diffusion facilitator CzcD-associated flavoprotein CzcO
VTRRDLRILILGAGFAGLGAAVRLKREGFHRLTIVDRGAEVGGTWRDNTYPGCACDVPSHLYSFSFDPQFDWSRPYAQQPQIFAYLNHIADTHGLRPHLRLHTEVERSVWDDTRQVWHVHLAGGDVLEADVLVSGIGALVNPKLPDLPGLASFTGPVFHSARWRHDVDLAGRRVALIGTGASAVQIAPALAPVTAHLSVFQRTAPWVMPRPDTPYGPFRRWLHRRVPGLLKVNRWRIWAFNEVATAGFLGHRGMAWLMRRLALRHLHRQLSDPDLITRATPSYATGCKRVLVSDTWYPTLQRRDVSLVTAGIDRVVPEGIVTRDGQLHPADAIVFGTGFVVTEFTALTHTRGRGGRDLAAQWTRAATTWLGISTPGFPNLFTLLGPGTGLGSNSIVFMLEAQMNHVVRAVRHLAGQPGAVEVREDAAVASYAGVQRRMKGTVWASGGCRSWYQSADGRIDTLWPDFTWKYWRRTRQFDPAIYQVHPAPGSRS